MIHDDTNDRLLMREALAARDMAWAPYSNYLVGAALLCADGAVVRGCNIENAAFTPGTCAERTAIHKAVSEGRRRFAAIAIVGGPRGGGTEYAYPCGVCRQVMMECCDASFRILVGTGEEDYRAHTLGELLPKGFGPANLEKR